MELSRLHYLQDAWWCRSRKYARRPLFMLFVSVWCAATTVMLLAYLRRRAHSTDGSRGADPGFQVAPLLAALVPSPAPPMTWRVAYDYHPYVLRLPRFVVREDGRRWMAGEEASQRCVRGRHTPHGQATVECGLRVGDLRRRTRSRCASVTGQQDGIGAVQEGGRLWRESWLRRCCKRIEDLERMGSGGVLMNGPGLEGTVAVLRPPRGDGGRGVVLHAEESVRVGRAVGSMGCSDGWKPLTDLFAAGQRTVVAGALLPLTLSPQAGSWQHFIDSTLPKLIQAIPAAIADRDVRVARHWQRRVANNASAWSTGAAIAHRRRSPGRGHGGGDGIVGHPAEPLTVLLEAGPSSASWHLACRILGVGSDGGGILVEKDPDGTGRRTRDYPPEALIAACRAPRHPLLFQRAQLLLGVYDPRWLRPVRSRRALVLLPRSPLHGRHIVNEAALVAALGLWCRRHELVLRQYGECESPSVAAMASCMPVGVPDDALLSFFADARVVVGAHGGALYNMLFCAKGTAVVGIGTRTNWYDYFDELASALGLDMWRVVARSADGHAETWIENHEQDMVVDVEQVIQTVGQIISSERQREEEGSEGSPERRLGQGLEDGLGRTSQ